MSYIFIWVWFHGFRHSKSHQAILSVLLCVELHVYLFYKVQNKYLSITQKTGSQNFICKPVFS